MSRETGVWVDRTSWICDRCGNHIVGRRCGCRKRRLHGWLRTISNNPTRKVTSL